MASEWEMQAMGVELGMGMGTYHHNASPAPMSSHHSGGGASYYSTAHHHHHHYYGMPPPMGDDASIMRVDDDLLDLSTGAGAGAHEFSPTAAATDNSAGAMVGEPSLTTANSSDHQTSSLLSYADEFYIPSEEAAELEWLSKFVDDSYSDMPNYSSSAAHHAAMAAAAAAGNNGGRTSAGQDSRVVTATAAPAGRGARSKRSSRASAAAWHSLVPHPPSQSSSSPSPSPCSSSDFFPSSSSSNKQPAARPNGGGSRGKKTPPGAGEEVGMDEGGVRRCTHCASDKTPQWRSGPLGPKTLCNACGVRFKSGRLVPEYRPAASPTFVLTQHSNSHRKVVELRRQKELILLRGTHRDAAAEGSAAAAGPRPELMFRDYGLC